MVAKMVHIYVWIILLCISSVYPLVENLTPSEACPGLKEKTKRTFQPASGQSLEIIFHEHDREGKSNKVMILINTDTGY